MRRAMDLCKYYNSGMFQRSFTASPVATALLICQSCLPDTCVYSFTGKASLATVIFSSFQCPLGECIELWATFQLKTH